jgi:hypothetical protein
VTTPFVRPDVLLDELGITEPGDIRIEAIAQHCGATIVYAPLDGCEARILGVGDKAIITVNEGSSRERQRFSAAHELGHWMRDRGRIAFSCAEGALEREWGPDNPERRANRYGADLLLPEKMIRTHARALPATFATARRLGASFQTSVTATAIRLVELGSCPAMIVCNESAGRKWFFRSPLLPTSLWLRDKPGAGSVAAKLLGGKGVATGPETVDADDWIEHPDASEYCVVEDSISFWNGAVLTLLWWKDEAQILALDRDDGEDDDD